MPKKHTYDEVKRIFESRGYELLETEYFGNKYHMKYKCPKHPDKELKIRLDQLVHGNGCIYCAGKAKHTYEDVKNTFEKKGYTLIDTIYVNGHTPLKYTCSKHSEYIQKIRYNDIIRGHGCLYCSGLQKKTIEEARKAFQCRGLVLLDDEIINVLTPMKCLCPNHPNKELFMTLSSITSGHGCKYCSSEKTALKTKHSFEFIKNEFIKKGYELLESDYFNKDTKMKYKCPNHPDKILKITYRNLKHGYGCPECGKIKAAKSISIAMKGKILIHRRKTHEQFCEEFKKVHNLKYIVIGKYIDIKSKIKIYCNKCKKEFEGIAGNLLRGSGCPVCSRDIIADKNRKTIDDAKQIFKERGYELLEDEYIDSSTPMKCKCMIHPDKILKKSLNRIQYRGACLYCVDSMNSKLVKAIEEYLNENNISYLREKTFEGCVYKNKLRFDFYVPNENTCIEADGEQHFRPSAFGGMCKEKALEIFESTQKRDKIKDDYCKNNNIQLLRIPYYEIDNVKTMLQKIFTKAS